MWIAAAVVVVLVLVILVLVLGRRAGKGDLGSVQRYHTAVSTLEHMPDRVGRTPLRIVEPSGSPVAADPPRQPSGPTDEGSPFSRDLVDHGTDPAPVHPPSSSPPGWTSDGDSRVPPVRVRGSEQFPDPETPLVFDDARPREPRSGDLPPGPTTPPRASRSQRHALDSMNHGGRRRTTIALVGLVVVVFVALAVIGSRHTPKHSSTATTIGHTSATTTGSSTHGHGTAPAHKPTPSTTTTTPSQLTPTTTSGGGVGYDVASAPFTLTIAATSSSWISVTSAATGTSVWSGLVPAGGHQAVTGAGSLDVVVGAPEITLSVNRIPVILPTPFHTPATLSFVVTGGSATATPSGAASAASTSTTTSTTASGTGTSTTSP